MQLSFFLDEQDAVEEAAALQLQQQLDAALRTQNLGILDDARYNEKGGFQQWTFLGHDAAAMLDLMRPLVAAADFLVGPRATLIIREAGSTKVQVKHLDL
ncbi:hypothetical protein [Cnuella takakiae]|uniref:hypothetical protein n=1 Tax=Cnuella takakiae TaxID=1302690 RepID=UPI00097B455F|nr:hypothetical protein [Cnuella takakiae]OLY93856.1 hypothetical protein BUE76_19715 [Cnuella takakiae]